MRLFIKSLFPMLAFSLLAISGAFCQGTPLPDTTKPSRVQVNAGFDVIIKKNGDILYGLVKEVGQELIRYQRTDIPDGPIYTVRRDEVFAISYRNQVKEIISPLKDTVATEALPLPNQVPTAHDTIFLHDTPASVMPLKKPDSSAKKFFLKDGNVRIGLGFLRSYTRVDQVGQYSSYASFPIVSIGYDVRYRDQIRLGVQLSIGPHKFSGGSYSSYDSTKTSTVLKETIFMLDAYAKYDVPYSTPKVKPYIMGGIGIHSAHVSTDYNINFITDPNHSLNVKSGNNSVGIGLMARLGAEYFINSQLRAFGDVGFGASVLNFGLCVRVD